MTNLVRIIFGYRVAPPVGAWIEIQSSALAAQNSRVAPPVGAWIEILLTIRNYIVLLVAPPVGAWIEIFRYTHPGM